MKTFFALCPRGLEIFLLNELSDLGALSCQIMSCGVLFIADKQTAYRINLWSRLASRVLCQVGEGICQSSDDLFSLSYSLAWEEYFSVDHTFRIDLTAEGLSSFQNDKIASSKKNRKVNSGESPSLVNKSKWSFSLNFGLLRVKDGIVDRFRTQLGQRPGINTADPDVRVFVHLGDVVRLYIDFSGEALFKRGWRNEKLVAFAPIKENLAAGLLQKSGWHLGEPLCDPFCGSATLLIEAAQVALDRAPGFSRCFGFEKLLNYEKSLWVSLKSEAQERAEAGVTSLKEYFFWGSDCDSKVVEQARLHVHKTGLSGIRIVCCRAENLPPPSQDSGFILSNLPYGNRVWAGKKGSQHKKGTGQSFSAHEVALKNFGSMVKRNFRNWKISLFSGEDNLPKILGIKAHKREPLWNGSIRCHLFSFQASSSIIDEV